MSSILPALLIVLPMLGGILCAAAVRRVRLCRVLSAATLLATLAVAVTLLVQARTHGGAVVSQMGDWMPPYGITLIVDPLAGLLIVSSLVVTVAGLCFGFGTLDPAVERRYYHPLLLFMTMGVNLSFLTGDLFNLFVAFEVMLMASYGLMTLGVSAGQVRHAHKYILMNLLASTLFVVAAGLCYGMLGTLNMADLQRLVADYEATGRPLPAGFTALGAMFFIVFALKAAVFPLWCWLPDTYPTLPTPVMAVFGGVLTKVGVYALARLFPTTFAVGEAAATLNTAIAVGATLTMLGGALGALAYRSAGRVSCMLLIAGVGYGMLGVAAGNAAGLGGAAFYMAQSMIGVCLLLMLVGLLTRLAGDDDLDRVGAVAMRRPWLAVALLVAGLSVVGLPPLPGFVGKLVLIRETLTADLWWAAVAGLLAGAIMLLAMLRMFVSVCWLPGEGLEAADTLPNLSVRPAAVTAGVLTLVMVALGVGANAVMPTALAAGDVTLGGRAYIDAVLSPPDAAPPATPHDAHDTPAHGGH